MRGLSPLRGVYLGLAIWGGARPAGWITFFGTDHGIAIGRMIGNWNANAGSPALARDMTIAAIALTVWVLAETRVRRNWSALVAIPATFGLGVACGLPLYLFLRARPVS